MAAGLTDLFGDVPYFTAFFNGTEGEVTPAYDFRKVFMNENGILDTWKGIAAIQNYNDAIPLQGDILIQRKSTILGLFGKSIKN
jgi:hypothetical protein